MGHVPYFVAGALFGIVLSVIVIWILLWLGGHE